MRQWLPQTRNIWVAGLRALVILSADNLAVVRHTRVLQDCHAKLQIP